MTKVATSYSNVVSAALVEEQCVEVASYNRCEEQMGGS